MTLLKWTAISFLNNFLNLFEVLTGFNTPKQALADKLYDANTLVFITKYSRLSLSRMRRDPLKYFEISVLRHIRCAELRKIPVEQPNFTNEHVI